MKVSDFIMGDRVFYIEPRLLTHHPGIVTSVNHRFVFVRFDEDVERLTFEGATSKACRAEDLCPELPEE